MSDPALSGRLLNRALLERQSLLERSAAAIPDVLERVGGLQAQYAPSVYVGLWSRLAEFVRADLTDALVERRIVQGTLMRSTIHLVSAADYPLLAAGIRRSRRDWWLRVNRSSLGEREMAAAADVVSSVLAAGPRRQRELVVALEEAGFPRAVWNGVGAFVDLLRVPPSGTWEHRRADLYALADGWLGPLPRVSEEEGIAHLVRRYVGGFGPAAVDDVASWAGVPAKLIRSVIDSVAKVRHRDVAGRQLFDLPGEALPDEAMPVPIRFLGTWEALLLVHARRSGVLPEAYRPRIFATTTPHSFPTFLLDGRVAGTWRHEDGAIRIDPFEALPRQARRQLDREAKALAAFHIA